MSTSNGPAVQAPTSIKGGQTPSSKEQEKTPDVRRQFVSATITMSWQLAIVVLVPIIGGVELDKAFGTSHVCLFIGLAIAAIGTTVVLWRTAQAANRIPVPKLTEAQRRAIKKSYEEEDEE